VRYLNRGGIYARVCDATWRNCGDTGPSKLFGGRWNAPGAFGVLYLCADRAVAAANARWAYERDGRFTLFDRRPDRRPYLQEFAVRKSRFVDAVTAPGLAALDLPASYPIGVSRAKCRAIGTSAYAEGAHGIGCRSAAEATREHIAGEELALFDIAGSLATPGRRIPFRRWYPLPHLR